MTLRSAILRSRTAVYGPTLLCDPLSKGLRLDRDERTPRSAGLTDRSRAFGEYLMVTANEPASLVDSVEDDGSAYINRDMAPTPLSARKWGARDIAALWISMS